MLLDAHLRTGTKAHGAKAVLHSDGARAYGAESRHRCHSLRCCSVVLVTHVLCFLEAGIRPTPRRRSVN
eukprot:3914091-Amphidinium_carterae.2